MIFLTFYILEGRKGNCNGEEHVTAKPGPVQLYKMDGMAVTFYIITKTCPCNIQRFLKL